MTLPDGGTTAVTFTAQWAYRTYPDYDDDDDDSSSSSSLDDEYTVRATASDGGYVSPSGTTYVDEGDDLTITFAPYSGYVIDGVYIDGVLDNSHDGSYTFRNVDEDHTLYVRYIADSGSGSSGSSGATSLARAYMSVSSRGNSSPSSRRERLMTSCTSSTSRAASLRMRPRKRC